MTGKTTTILAALLLLGGGGVAAQGISITPSAGAYIPASDFYDLRDELDDAVVRADREAAFALGLAVEAGWLRGSLAYATGATVSRDGVSGSERIGDGTLLLGAADLVVRPVPRVFVQPYLLGGVGFRNTNYDSDDPTAILPEGETDAALHIGVGADLLLGSVSLVAEVSDFISRDADDDWSEHDAFAMVGLKFRLGNR